MYSKVKSCVRSNDGLTEFFPYNKGLRQGCLLSPLLFALFLNDLNNFLLKESSGITIWDIQICAMLYADDLILLAESEQDLQTHMNSLGTYADIFRMEVNQKKTKVLIFDKPAKLKKRASKTWSIGNINIEEDQIYKYLGVVFISKGSFIEHANTLKEKANKACYSIVARSKEWQGFNPKTVFHIFDHTILPILNYGADIWGGKEWIELEKLHLSVCKYIFGVSHSTPTDGIYAELSRHPLQISRKIAIVKYLKRLTELSDDRLAETAFRQLSLDDNNNHYNWVSMANSILNEFSLDITDSEDKLKTKVRSIYNKTLVKSLTNCMNQRKKLRTYAKFKTEIKFENYLDTVNDFKIRRKLTQFCLGVLDLEIERGRYGRKPLPIEERLCKLCLDIKIQAVEDEIHFLLHCPYYTKQTERLFEKLTQMHYDLHLLEDSDKFIWLLSQENNNCVHWLSNFIFSATKIRKDYLEST